MIKMKTVPQFRTRKTSGKRRVKYLDFVILIKSTQDTIKVILDAVEAYYGRQVKR